VKNFAPDYGIDESCGIKLTSATYGEIELSSDGTGDPAITLDSLSIYWLGRLYKSPRVDQVVRVEATLKCNGQSWEIMAEPVVDDKIDEAKIPQIKQNRAAAATLSALIAGQITFTDQETVYDKLLQSLYSLPPETEITLRQN
jgi:hypothetical protein